MLTMLSDLVDTLIRRFGGWTDLPNGKFSWDIREELEFSVASVSAAPASQRITLGVLSDIVYGLRLFLLDQNHHRGCYFQVEKVIGGRYTLAGHGLLIPMRQEDRPSSTGMS